MSETRDAKARGPDTQRNQDQAEGQVAPDSVIPLQLKKVAPEKSRHENISKHFDPAGPRHRRDDRRTNATFSRHE